jgi:hypothetical protein
MLVVAASSLCFFCFFHLVENDPSRLRLTSEKNRSWMDMQCLKDGKSKPPRQFVFS